MNKLIKCPVCEGSGKQAIEVHEGSTVRSVEIECYLCNGQKTIAPERKRAFDAERKVWCRCGNPSGESTFHDDGERQVCRKHHYTCNDCGKITQIG